MNYDDRYDLKRLSLMMAPLSAEEEPMRRSLPEEVLKLQIANLTKQYPDFERSVLENFVPEPFSLDYLRVVAVWTKSDVPRAGMMNGRAVLLTANGEVHRQAFSGQKAPPHAAFLGTMISSTRRGALVGS